ncbi:MAG TPA: di-heme oxidoredictase family protein [Bauldia sp.]|nr:di-heme oxidoredictase family protein [Bauldia sp.]
MALPSRVDADDAAEPWSEAVIREHVDITKYEHDLNADELGKLVEAGRLLFTDRFTSADGMGRPLATQAIIPTKRKQPVDALFRRTAGMDANSCESCHNSPIVGAAATFTGNAFVSEGFESADFETLDGQFSNERGSVHLFGNGLLQMLAREMTAELQGERDKGIAEARKSGQPVTIQLASKGVEFGSIVAQPDGLVDFAGLDGIDQDLILRPFSQKGVFGSTRQFVVNAMNVHVGLEATERFGARWTGTHDFDGDGHPDEFTPGDVSATVAFIGTLPAPNRMVPDDQRWVAAAKRGEQVFADLGCTACHKPFLPLNSLKFSDPGPDDTAGTLRVGEVPQPITYDYGLLPWTKKLQRNDQGQILVPLFGDLKRHKIADDSINRLGNELLAQRFVERDVFMTAELWGVGSTAPYGHRNDITTLDEVIRAHGGEGTTARNAFIAATDADRSALIAFLKTLVIPQ